MGMLAGRVGHVIGVDTHRDAHAAAICDPAGGVRHQFTLSADGRGYAGALAVAGQRAPGPRVWAIEGTGGFGAGLARYLLERGEWVVEVERPKRPARRKGGAKSDPIDAVRAAREALAADQLACPRRRGEREALRVLLATRHAAIRARTAAIAQLKALIVAAPEHLRAQLRGLAGLGQLRRCQALRAHPGHSPELRATVLALRATARRALALGGEAQELEREIAALVGAIAPELLTLRGVGPISAAQLVVSFSHPGRFRSEAAFASLAGVAPIPASSGEVVRHRLNRGGDRQLNRALDVVVRARLARCPTTRAYMARRRAEGRTAREVTRCLRRYVARELFRALEAALAERTSAGPPPSSPRPAPSRRSSEPRPTAETLTDALARLAIAT